MDLEWMYCAMGLFFGIFSGSITTLVCVQLIRIVCIISRKLEPAKEVVIQLSNDDISADVVSMLRQKKLVFADLPKLGEGGTSKVYKGTLASGKCVALKVVRSTQADHQLYANSSVLRAALHHSFWYSTAPTLKSTSTGMHGHQAMSEMETLGKIRHHNLARIYAYAKTRSAQLLVYELAENGSLKDALSKVREGTQLLPWKKRKIIATGLVTGLTYLHYDCIPRILHRDIKTANILLDEDFLPQLSDFGLARAVSSDVMHLSASKIVGTPGYYAPEYANTGKYSMASDVYSTGVSLGALLCGKDPTDIFFEDVDGGMLGWMKYLIEIGQEERGFDATLLAEQPDKYQLEEMRKMMRVVCYCTRPRPADRPTSAGLLKMLQDTPLHNALPTIEVLSQKDT